VEDRLPRKLAVIMHADIVDYSRLAENGARAARTNVELLGVHGLCIVPQ